MDVIETKHLRIGTWNPSDAKALYSYAGDPEVGPAAGWRPHPDAKWSKRIIKKIFIPKNVWKIVYKKEDQIIGSISLEKDLRRYGVKSVELGYSLSREFWGKGLMTEAVKGVLDHAFKKPDMEVVSVCTSPVNLRSKRVIEKCGFTYEGTLRKAYMTFDGEARDVCCYSMLKKEWEENES